MTLVPGRQTVPDRDTTSEPLLTDDHPDIAAVLAMPKGRQQRIWERHLMGVQPAKIADEVGIPHHLVTSWIRRSYQELLEDVTERPGHMIKRRRMQAVSRLTMISRKAYNALSRLIPPEPDGVIDEAALYGDGKSLTQGQAGSISRLLETLIRVEEVRSRIEGTAVDGRFKTTDPAEQGGSDEGPTLPPGVVEHRLVIIRRSRTDDAVRLPALTIGDDPTA